MNCVKRSQVSRLQKFQNHTLRIIFRETLTHPTFDLHTRANLLSLALRREACILRIVNIKLIKGDNVFRTAIRTDNRTRDGTKGGIKLHLDPPKLERFKKLINYVGPSLWNMLPEDCRANQWPPAIKSNIQRFLWDKFKRMGRTH